MMAHLVTIFTLVAVGAIVLGFVALTMYVPEFVALFCVGSLLSLAYLVTYVGVRDWLSGR